MKEGKIEEMERKEVMLKSNSMEREYGSEENDDESGSIIDWVDYVDKLVNRSEI